MKKRVRLILVIAVVLLLATGWTWRYITLNQYYDGLDNGDYQLFQTGELVPFENDGNDKDTDLNGYHIRADSYEIRDFEEYVQQTGITPTKIKETPDKLVLVSVTLVNESDNPNPVILTEMKLHGVDSVTFMSAEMLTKVNPILEGDIGIALSPETECQLILPFGLYEQSYSRRTWRNIVDYQLYLQVTNTLTTKEILLSE